MKYYWSAKFSLPGARRNPRSVTLTKSWDGKDYLKIIEKCLYDSIIAILGEPYVQQSKKPDIRLTVTCFKKRSMERKLAKKMKEVLEERLSKTTKQLELF